MGLAMLRPVQMLLDLFEAPAPAGASPVQPSPKAPVPGNPAPAGQSPAAPVPAVSGVVEFRHPEAKRQVALSGAVVAYALQRTRRRSIGLVIAPDGLVVRAPRWVTLGQIESAVREKGDWILRKLAESRTRQQRMDSARIDWREGAELPFLGNTIRLALDPRHGFGAAGAELDAEAGVLRLALAHDATPAQIRDTVQAWLMREAKRLFTERLDHFAPRLDVQWRRLSLSSAGTRWGSANATGAIRLHWRLVHFRLEVIDYVVAHELSHLRVMDHSPRFWDTVAEVLPDYAALRGQLRDAALPAWN